MPLLDQSEAATLPAGDWRAGAFADIAARLTPPSEFPCTFSQNAFRRGLIRFLFVEAADEAALTAAGHDLLAYVEESRDWDGQTNTARPLLMLFAPDALPASDLAAHHAFGWKALNHWRQMDPSPWPADVPRDPHAPFWSFCLAGTQLFVNMSSPAHVRRKSRNLGRAFALVINPRERFDVVAGNTPEGHRTRAAIRARATAYDGMPHSALLGHYQKGELEWVQYALPDGENVEVGRCPFEGGSRG